MAQLSKRALKMLEDAGCTEVGDYYVMLFNSDVTIQLSNAAIVDLNRQAHEHEEDQP